MKLNYLGIIIVITIGILLSTALFGDIGNNIGTLSKTFTITNRTFTTATVGAYVDLIGQELIGTAIVVNASNGAQNANVTVEEGISPSTGYKRIRMKTNDATWANKQVNVSYTYGAEGYIEDSSGRAIAVLITIFAALLIMVVALYPVIKYMRDNFI